MVRTATSGRPAEVYAQDNEAAEVTPKPPADFKGVFKLDVRNSKNG